MGSSLGRNSSASALGWHSEAGEICTDGLCAGTEYMSCEEAGEAQVSPKRLVIESPWSQFTREYQLFLTPTATQ